MNKADAEKAKVERPSTWNENGAVKHTSSKLAKLEYYAAPHT